MNIYFLQNIHFCMEAKYARTLVMSFTGLASILGGLNQNCLKNLLDQPKFWKYSKNKYGSVRQGFYEFLFQLCSQPASGEK